MLFRSADALGKGHASQHEQAAQQPERSGKPERAQREAVGVAQFERNAQHRVRRNPDELHQTEKLDVGTDENMLPVIEIVPVRAHSSRASTRDQARFEHHDAHTRGGKRHCGRHPCVPAADDRYAVIQVFHAIQNLRSGVSEVRCVSTLKPSRSISTSSWR